MGAPVVGAARKGAPRNVETAKGASDFRLRPLLVVLHRFAGLATALFLMVAGLTGSLIAFFNELDALLNPSAYAVKAEGEPLSPSALARKVEASDPRISVWYATIEKEKGHPALVVAQPRIDPQTGKPFEIDANWFNVDPVSGEILGKRLWGECCFGSLNFLPFMYELHHNLSIPGQVGVVLMGVVAIVWVFDCLIGLALTFPRGRPFLAKWGTAFTIKGGSSFRLNIDLHRAFGLWLWLVLLAVAVSSVAMNLRKEVFEPVVSLFSELTPSPFETRGAPSVTPIPTPHGFDDVLPVAVEEAKRRGIALEPGEVFYSQSFGLFGVGLGDHDDPLNNPFLYFDGKTLTPTGAVVPGTGTAGDVFIQLQYPIHGGRIGGLFGRILIAATGVVVALLSITGIAIWWMKRKGRKERAAREKLKAAAAAARVKAHSPTPAE